MTATIDPRTEQAVRIFLERAGEAFKLKEALLFGSRARQSHRLDSDADLAVLLRGPSRPFLNIKLALADIAFDVLLETGILIQPLPIWEDEWEHPEHNSAPALIRNVRRQGIRL